MSRRYGSTTAPWDAARVRQKYGLYLNDEEKRAIRAKLPGSDRPEVFYADGVFEGGGVLNHLS
jgi:hypothetical protein